MRQRIDSAAVASGSVITPAAAAHSSAAGQPSPAAPVSRLSLMGLAVVERQLIMQMLDIFCLARLASTCAQLRGEALHKQAGKFISKCPRHRGVNSDDPAHASALFRAHAPVHLTLSDDLALAPALLDKAATFSRITQLHLGSRAWTEARLLELLAQPWTASILLLHVCSMEWLRSPAVQHALFALPNLTSIQVHVKMESRDPRPLLESAVAQATKLTTTTLFMWMGQEWLARGIRAAPALITLELCVSPQLQDAGVESLAPLIWLMPPTLTALRLHAPFPCFLSRAAVKTMFVRFLILRTVLDPAMLIQGMLDAGLSALPDLRRVEFGERHRQREESASSLPAPISHCYRALRIRAPKGCEAGKDRSVLAFRALRRLLAASGAQTCAH